MTNSIFGKTNWYTYSYHDLMEYDLELFAFENCCEILSLILFVLSS